MNEKLRILLAEDHLTVREGIKMLVNAQPDMEVVGEADNGEIAIAETARLKPDMIIMDISMPVLNGLKATKRLRESCPDLLILALTRHTDDGYLQQLIGAGANGYVLKQSAPTELINAIRAIGTGQAYLDPALTQKVMGGYAVRNTSLRGEGKKELSSRENEVRRAYAQVGQELASQYGLGYVPSNRSAKDEWREVVVEVGRPNLDVRTRSGYRMSTPAGRPANPKP